MATKKPRISITVSDEMRELLDRLSDASGIAASQFISQIVHNATPVIVSMIRAFELARDSPQQAAAIMGEAVNEGMIQLAQQQLALTERSTRRRLRRRPVRD